MRVAIFTNNYLPNPYGVTQSIKSFLRQLEKRGNTVFIFAPYCKNYKDENPNACLSGRQVFRYPALDISYKIKFPLAIPYSRKMDKILENLKIDIIHSQHPNLLGTAAMKWAKRKNIPLVFTWHTLYDQYVHFVPFISAKWVAKYIIKKAVNYANKCDLVITPTESVKKIIQNWGVNNKNIKAVSSGVDEENFASPDGKIIRDKYGIKDNEILLLLVSRLTKEKNVEFVLNSLIPLLKKNKQVKFFITGGGDLVPKLKETVKNNDLESRIIFEDVVEREEIKNYYAAGDIFVYASKSETQGMIITEAMYCGLPIVAVNASGICDLVENNISGFLVDEDVNIFAEAVEKLIQDKNLREQFGSAGAQITREKYTDKICAEKLIEIYNRVIRLNS